MPEDAKLSAAAKRARERLNSMEEFARVPTIAPAVGVNRAKQEDGGNLTAPTDVNNPGATAQVNGDDRTGKESPTPQASGLAAQQTATLPEGLTGAQVAALDKAGIKTLNDSLQYSDAALKAFEGVGDGTIALLRDAATAQGLTWAQG